MTIPVWVLLGFAVWTLVALMATVGIYRWSLILTRRAAVSAFRADRVEGSDFYKRAMRAHVNCVENLPVYGAIVIAIVVCGATSPALDVLAVVLLAARVIHTLVHVSVEQTNAVASVRFVFFFAQLAAMLAMSVIVALHALR